MTFDQALEAARALEDDARAAYLHNPSDHTHQAALAAMRATDDVFEAFGR